MSVPATRNDGQVDAWIKEGRDRGFLEPPRLDELATTIVEHHRAASEYARRTLEHVFACGDALIEAREMVPEGQWRAWLRENVTMDQATAGMYVRLATFRDELVAAGIDRVQAARDYVREHGLTVSVSGGALSREVVLEIRALADQGLSHRKIAKQLGVGKSSVGRIQRGERHRDQGPDPPKRRRQRRPCVEITDGMIESMARWLCATFTSRFPQGISDEVRAVALDALGAALGADAV